MSEEAPSPDKLNVILNIYNFIGQYEDIRFVLRKVIFFCWLGNYKQDTKKIVAVQFMKRT